MMTMPELLNAAADRLMALLHAAAAKQPLKVIETENLCDELREAAQKLLRGKHWN